LVLRDFERSLLVAFLALDRDHPASGRVAEKVEAGLGGVRAFEHVKLNPAPWAWNHPALQVDRFWPLPNASDVLAG